MAEEEGQEQELDLQQVEREAHDVLATLFNKHGLMLTKWQLAAEVITTDGSRDFVPMASPDYRLWDAIGLGGYGQLLDEGRVVAGEMHIVQFEEDGDEGEGVG